jgi:hypothetical protein
MANRVQVRDLEPVAFVSADGTFEPWLDMLPHYVVQELLRGAGPDSDEERDGIEA